MRYESESESESESGSRARTPTQASARAEAQVRAKMWAEAEAQAEWARAQAQAQAERGAKERARARARAEAEARAEDWARAQTGLKMLAWGEEAQAQATKIWEEWTWAQAKERAQAQAEGGVEDWAQAQAELKMWEEEARAQAMKVWALAYAEAMAHAEAKAHAEVRAPWAPAESLVRALAQARVGVMDQAGLSLEQTIELLPEAQNGWWIQFLPPEPMLPHPSHRLTYDEVLADLKIKDILDSIIPQYRHELTHNLWRHSEHFWLIQIITPVTRLPPELLQQIFSTIINDDTSGPPLILMLVCKYWYTTVTGIWASLKLGTSTPRDAVANKLERNPWLLDIVVDTEIDRYYYSPSKAAYEAIFAAVEATSRWRSLVVETFPRQADLPEHLVDRGLQRYSNATMSRLRSFKIKRACEISPLLERLLRILGTTASPELSTMEINSANVIMFLVPTYSLIFRSVKVLFLEISGRHDPVDLLPHLHQLESLTASHLSLPTYGHDIHLPFVNTLRHLTLRAVSIQWMSGRTFDVLESCAITFPPHRHTLPIVGTTIPNCKQFTFQGYPLDILDGISAQTNSTVCDMLRYF